ncbi:rhodanese-like domain-containing protein [Haloimpatiens lingqiaonensis]|uniref:rhodanese-like domain-containing protein n=1 Tax=Haloimpatiens lingqiaonensis TaxID=1380675 RepID=UPI0010FD3A95|nr:rhodanese-like domain-containing protein [Haloimpatiens lingqiaonensis]
MSELKKAVEFYFEDLKKGCNNLIDCETLFKNLSTKDKLFILDIRKEADFEKGHIESAIHSEWPEVWDFIDTDALPKDKKIIVVCYTGQTAGQVVSILKLLGYDACSLKGGMMNGWNKSDMPIKSGCD